MYLSKWTRNVLPLNWRGVATLKCVPTVLHKIYLLQGFFPACTRLCYFRRLASELIQSFNKELTCCPTCTQNMYTKRCIDLLLTKYLQRRSFNVEAYLWLRFICCFVRSINKSCFKSGDDFTRVTTRVHFSEFIWIWLTYCTCKCHDWSQTNASLYYNFSTRNLIRSNIY